MKDMDSFNPLANYNYIEQNRFIPTVYGVIINDEDKILSITENGSLLAQVALDLEANKLSLIGKDGILFSTVDLPLVDVIENAVYDETTQSLIIYVKLSDGSTKEIVVPFSDLLESYAKKDALDTEVARAIAAEKVNADAIIAEQARAEGIEAKKIDWSDISANRKAITLNNDDMLLGSLIAGGTVNLAMVNKWDVADYGSSTIHTNLNSKDRPTVQLPGVSGDLAEGIAYISDVEKSEKVNADAIVAESEARVLGDNKLATDLASETTRAIDAEKVNSDAIVAEAVIARTAEKANADAIIAEQTRAEGVEVKKVDWSDISIAAKPNRKGISLKNDDMLLGDDTTGTAYNLAMVNKWNVADYGSSSIHFNINSQDRPTVQLHGVSGDLAEGIAYISDIAKSDKTSSDAIIAESEARILADTKLTTDLVSEVTRATDAEKVNSDAIIAESEARVLGDDKLASDLTSEIARAIAAEKANADSIVAEEIRANGIEGILRTDVDKLRVDVDYESSRALEAEANINNALETKVTWDVSKTKIVLPSGGQLVGTKFGVDPLDGATIAQLNQWDVMDFGSSKYPLNLNVPASVRPTVQEQGQSGADAHKIAYVSDVELVGTNLANEVIRAMGAEKINEDSIKSIVIDNPKTLQYDLKIDGNVVSTILIPESGIIKTAKYDELTKQIVIEFNMADGSISAVTVDVADLIDIYTAGDGLSESGNKFTVIVSPSSQNYLTSNADGLSIINIDEKFLEESDRAKAAEKVNADAIAAETNARALADTALQTEIDLKVSSVELVKDAADSLHYTLMVDSVNKGEINIPKDQFLKSASYDDVTKELVFVFIVESGETTTKIDVSSLVDVYTAGNGLLEFGNQFSVKLNTTGADSFLTVDADGLKLSGIQALFTAMEARITALETEVTKLKAMKFVTSDNITTIVQATQSEYNAMVKDPKALYIIIG